jgi:excisionase family DNA binding protein
MAETLLTIDQVAERLQIHPASVRRQLREGSLRGLKRGKLWRVPESALYEPTSLTHSQRVAPELAQANAIWADMNSGDDARRDQALLTLFNAPEAVQAVVMQRSGEASARYYATPEGEAELADWRALDGEPFHDDLGDYYTQEEEAQFRTKREAAHSTP